jgi:putative cardiolipin synthase
MTLSASARARLLAFALALAAVLLSACTHLPTLDGRTLSSVVEDTSDTRIGTALRPLLQSHPGFSGVVLLADGRDAFAARASMVRAAQRTLDVQYYIWRPDLSGSLLLDALRGAADRGVRVRLLLDDNNTAGLDEILRSLDDHANIEVRLFNPFAHRQLRALDFLTDFSRVNRRMHNKSFTADNQVTVIGGRNVGDEYFGATQGGLLFLDMDVLAVGPVVTDVSRDFDRYWASASAYPVDRLLPSPAVAPAALPAVEGAVQLDAIDAYREAIARSAFMRDLLARQLPFEWAPVRMISDDPSKGLGRADANDLLWARLRELMAAPGRDLQLVSPYFVPTARGVAFFSELVRSGVRVRVLTNALEATDVPAVHAGYARWRKPLLAAGVQLFELKRMAALPAVRERGLGGSSDSSLHAKTIVIDGARVFVGSFNFDPRSARLNTELGFVIESPALAARMMDRFNTRVPALAYRVEQGDDGLRWIEQSAEGVVVYRSEPHTGFWQRLGVSLLSLLPIESLL